MAVSNIIVPHAPGELSLGGFDQPFSSPEQYVIFSIDPWNKGTGIDDGDKVSETTADVFDGFLKANQIDFKRLVGSYKGVEEPSWIINARHWEALRNDPWLQGQESILHLGRWDHGGRPATLYFNPDQIVPIGQFSQASEAYARKQDGWTFDPSIPAYFICQ